MLHRCMFILMVAIVALTQGMAQTRIDLDAYRRYRADREGLTAEGLLREFPAGTFRESVRNNPTTALYFDSIASKYLLTNDERDLIQRHGFVVAERLSFDEYYRAYYDSYQKDLPVYISADALLHAFHRTYANILKDVERFALSAMLVSALDDLALELRRMPVVTSERGRQARADVDVYVAVARALVHGHTTCQPSDAANTGRADTVLQALLAERPVVLSVFTSVPRMFDFSQCKPRGHYAGDELLERYFRAMMWLGRTEIYITAPVGVQPEVPSHDVLRQCGMAVYLAKAMARSSARHSFAAVDTLLRAFLGEQDNVASQDVIAYVEASKLDVDALGDASTLAAFQNAMIEAGGAQQILSQILISNGTEEITPAASWMVMGQRFLYDSFVLANVVFDKTKELRMMPDPLDALFVLGNDATAQLLMPQIEQWKYAQNLAALRYLTNTFDDDYWDASLYTSWLAAIRTLNPPAERASLPQFMQTAAWWQKSINTQLASWAELRHDNLLYGKQSYTGGLGCFYPRGFVEPVPALYRRLATAAVSYRQALLHFADVLRQQGRAAQAEPVASMATGALDHMATTMAVLDTIATKELASIPLTPKEQQVIDGWIMIKDPMGGGCVLEYNGYYPRMLYGVSNQVNQQPVDHLLADVHTQPTDEVGNPVGRVLHVGTGMVNLAIVTADDPADGCLTSYVGPVSSYYEHITENFTRLTDQEWRTYLKEHPYPARPAWTRTYLANSDGRRSQQDGPSLIVTTVRDERVHASDMTITPNPTSAVALITVTLPTAAGKVRIDVIDGAGRVVQVLADRAMEQGVHVLRWEGVSDQHEQLPAASYMIRIVADGAVRTSPLVMTR